MTTVSSSVFPLALVLLEVGLCLIAYAVACFWPNFGASGFSHVESLLMQVARRPRLAVVVSGVSLVVLRLAILPVFPVPHPFIPDDFSFLLAADTFASGRLTNPTPAMWAHFESFHIDMHPSYMSMYFPAQGLLLAVGKVVFGHPWFAVLLCGALMCSAICWMLQAWLPPGWAFLGAMLAVLRLGLFSYWINTYTGGAAITALGGALVLGAFPRYLRSRSHRHAALLGTGMVLLMLSRPYEGMLLCFPVLVVLLRRVLRPHPIARRAFLRTATIPVLLMVMAGSWLAYYDYRVFGKPLTLPYTLNRVTYARAPYYVWQTERPEPAYRHAVMEKFYDHDEMVEYVKLHQPHGFFISPLMKLARSLWFFAGFSLLLPLVMVRHALMDRRIRFLVICSLVLAAGLVIEIFLIPHYLAPFTVVFYAIGLQCMRHLRVWRPSGRPVGLALVRACVVVCVGMAILRLFTKPLHIVIEPWPSSNWAGLWYGPEPFGGERARIQEQLESMPGKHLVMVRYSDQHCTLAEWVYNSANIDSSKVIWAREMGRASDQELIRYYRDRQVWLVQPDVGTGQLTRYPGVNLLSSQSELASSEPVVSGRP